MTSPHHRFPSPRLPLGPAVALAAAALLPACFPGAANRLSAWEKERLESRTADDLEEFADESGETGSGLDVAATARGEWSDCFVGYAGCQRCYVAEGNATAGTVSMDLSGVPCTASLTLDDVTYTYTIEQKSWQGDWLLGEDGWYDVNWSGSKDSALVVEGSANWDGTYDASWVMNHATAVTDGDGNLGAWSVDYDYSGFLDRTWHVDVTKDDTGAVSGTVTSDDGVTCAVSGQDYDYVVDCD